MTIAVDLGRKATKQTNKSILDNILREKSLAIVYNGVSQRRS